MRTITMAAVPAVEQEVTLGVSNRVLANRLNARKSTGPKTEQGKANSRCNAVKHGLAGQGVVLPHRLTEIVKERSEAWLDWVQPASPIQAEIVLLAATTMTQVMHGWSEESMARARSVDRAEQAWDADRESEIAELAAKLKKEPERILPKLKQSAHGAAWLMERWEAIAQRLDAGDEWTDARRSQALDLLGVAAIDRDQHSPLDRPDAAENPDALREQRRAVVREQIEILGKLLDESLIPLDDSDRRITLANLMVVPDAHVSRLQRYNKALNNRLLMLLPDIRKLDRAGGPGGEAANQTKPSPPTSTETPKGAMATVVPSPVVKPIAGTACQPPATRQPAPVLTTTPVSLAPKPAAAPSLLPPEFQNLAIHELEAAALCLDPTNQPLMREMTALVNRKIAEYYASRGD